MKVLLLLVVLVPQFAYAQQFEKGDVVLPKVEAEFWQDTTQVDPTTVDLPLTIQKVNDQRLYFGDLWTDATNVVLIDQATAHFTDYLSKNPTSAKALYYRGLACGINGEIEKAIEDMTESIRIDSNFADPYSLRGHYRLEKGEIDKGLKDINEAIRIRPNFAEAYILRANAWETKGELEKAIKDCTEAIRINPNFAQAYLFRAYVWGTKGESDKLVKDSTEAIRINPKFVDAYFLRGYAWHSAGKLDQAVEDYSKVIGIEPNHAMAYFNRGSVRFEKGEFDEAIKDLNESIRIDSKRADVFAGRGVIWHKQGELTKSISDFTEAIRLDPDNSEMFYSRGLAWITAGETDKAIDDLSEAIRLNPDYPNGHSLIAWVYATSSNETIRNGKKAVEHATKACELTGWREIASLNSLAAAHAELSEFDEAIKWQKKTVKLATNITDRLKTEAILDLYEKGKPYQTKTGDR